MFAIEVSIKINVYVLTQNRSTGYLVSHRFNFLRGAQDLLVTIRLTVPESPRMDALPQSYRRLMGAKATKLGSCDKHLAYTARTGMAICTLYTQ